MNEPGVDWVSTYDPAVSIGTVTATDTFDLDDTIHKISQREGDYIRIVDASDDTVYYDFTLVSPDRLKHFSEGNYVAKVGNTLKFNRTFATTDPEFGGTINVPAYVTPDDVANSTDDITIDDPNWLVTICAAENVRNDLVRQNQYPNLVAEANELMAKMKENNRPQLETITKTPAALGRSW